MTPAQAIGMLDRQLARHGQDVRLRKQAAASGGNDKTVRALVRGFRPDELASGVEQGDSTLVLSPTGLAASGFDGQVRRMDKVLVADALKIVQVANLVRIGNEVVRIELWVRGAS